MCLNIGTLKTVNFPFGTNGKLMVLGVPTLKHFRVYAEVNRGAAKNGKPDEYLRYFLYYP